MTKIKEPERIVVEEVYRRKNPNGFSFNYGLKKKLKEQIKIMNTVTLEDPELIQITDT